jgi:hypothetical protein
MKKMKTRKAEEEVQKEGKKGEGNRRAKKKNRG